MMIAAGVIFAALALILAGWLLIRNVAGAVIFLCIMALVVGMWFSSLGRARPMWAAPDVLHEDLILRQFWVDEPRFIYLVVTRIHSDEPLLIALTWTEAKALILQAEAAKQHGGNPAQGNSLEMRLRLDGMNGGFNIIDPPTLPPKAGED